MPINIAIFIDSSSSTPIIKALKIVNCNGYDYYIVTSGNLPNRNTRAPPLQYL